MDIDTDEKKPFDAEMAVDDDAQPDPEEILNLDQGNGRVWMVKIPKYLLERWTKIDQDNVHLANIRIYHNAVNPTTGRVPRIIMTLPSHSPGNPNNDSEEPDIFELDMVNEAVENQVVVAERPKEPQNPLSRARTTILTGRVKHECNIRPRFSEGYRQRIKERTRQANTHQRQIMMIDDAMLGGQGKINQLSSGVANGRGFSDLVKQKPKTIKGQFERMARMPRNQLLDALFALFRERVHWPIKLLRERTQQPEMYLKEVLAEIAFLHRSGEHSGTWELKANFKEDSMNGDGPGPNTAALYAANAEKSEYMDEEEEDEDDEDDDMEEVS